MRKSSLSQIIGGLSLMGLTLTLTLPSFSVQGRNIVKSHQNCVAYKTHKTMALVADTEIIGMNCNVSVKAIKTSEGLYSAEVNIPISGFNSQEEARDKEVTNLLHAKENSSLRFLVDPLSESIWKSILLHGSGAVKGKLYIGTQSYPLSTTIHVDKSNGKLEVYGEIIGKFSQFGIQPPQIGPGGIIAKAADYLELHFNFLANQLQNKALIPS